MEKIHGNVCFMGGEQIEKKAEKVFIGKTIFECKLLLWKS